MSPDKNTASPNIVNESASVIDARAAEVIAEMAQLSTFGDNVMEKATVQYLQVRLVGRSETGQRLSATVIGLGAGGQVIDL